MLGAIRYQRNEAVLHTDTRLLPRRRWPGRRGTTTCCPSRRRRVALTYNMNILQGLRRAEPFW